jgi:polysaccharide biosynthesis/export protein
MSSELHGNPTATGSSARRPRGLVSGALLVACLLALSGCQEAAAPIAAQDQKEPESQTITAGDVLKISFPGTPNLDTTQAVRRDGRISLSIIGEVVVTGMTPADLEKDLAKRYTGQLLSSEVNVTVVSSTFSIFVTGAVLRPGKIQPDHPISALEAVMEAGGFDTAKADMESVVVVRQEGGSTKNYTVNLKEVLDGKSHALFYLKPSDIVYVKEKFQWF